MKSKASLVKRAHKFALAMAAREPIYALGPVERAWLAGYRIAKRESRSAELVKALKEAADKLCNHHEGGFISRQKLTGRCELCTPEMFERWADLTEGSTTIQFEPKK